MKFSLHGRIDERGCSNTWPEDWPGERLWTCAVKWFGRKKTVYARVVSSHWIECGATIDLWVTCDVAIHKTEEIAKCRVIEIHPIRDNEKRVKNKLAVEA